MKKYFTLNTHDKLDLILEKLDQLLEDNGPGPKACPYCLVTPNTNCGPCGGTGWLRS